MTSGRPSLSFSSTYGLSWTLFKSSCKPSKRNARSSCESCCWKPLNLGAYFPIVHCNKKMENLFHFKLLLDHYAELILCKPSSNINLWYEESMESPALLGELPLVLLTAMCHTSTISAANSTVPSNIHVYYFFLCKPPNATPVSHDFLSCRLGTILVHDSCCKF